MKTATPRFSGKPVIMNVLHHGHGRSAGDFMQPRRTNHRRGSVCQACGECLVEQQCTGRGYCMICKPHGYKLLSGTGQMNATLRALSNGAKNLSEIANATGMTRAIIPNILRKLARDSAIAVDGDWYSIRRCRWDNQTTTCQPQKKSSE